MHENNLENIQNLLRRFQKKMMTKATTVRGQWNCVTCLKNLSQVQLARRMNVFGINATMSEVAQLFHYMGFRKNTMSFDDFMNLMEVDPELLGTQTKSLSPKKELFEHETMREYENDVNRYCRNTSTLPTPSQTRNLNTTNRKKKKTGNTRPFISSNSDNLSPTNKSNKKKGELIRSNKNQSNSDDEPNNYNNTNDTHDYNNTNNEENTTNYYNDSNYNQSHDQECSYGTFSYEPCRTCLERSLSRTVPSKKMRDATLKSFSSSSIQRQEYDGEDKLKTLTYSNGTPLRTLVRKISEIAYSAHPSSWSCFLKWRDPHHDLLDADDLRNGLKYAENYIITKADAEKVIDRYGGPMNHSTFAVMLHDGSQFNTSKVFTDEDIY